MNLSDLFLKIRVLQLFFLVIDHSQIAALLLLFTATFLLFLVVICTGQQLTLIYRTFDWCYQKSIFASSGYWGFPSTKQQKCLWICRNSDSAVFFIFFQQVWKVAVWAAEVAAMELQAVAVISKGSGRIGIATLQQQ